MARPTPQHNLPAPAGFCWVNEASELTGRSIETLYKDRKTQRRGGKCSGPASVTLNGKAAWRLDVIQAWLDGAETVGPSAEQLHNSRPAEIAA